MKNICSRKCRKGAEEGILRGIYLFKAGEKKDLRVQLFGSGRNFK